LQDKGLTLTAVRTFISKLILRPY